MPDDRSPNNMAYNPTLEACGGSSGNCLTVNGDTCCLGVMSYEYQSRGGPCESSCSNYWSGISSAKPLSDLWSDIQYSLPLLDSNPLVPPTPAQISQAPTLG